MSLILKKNDRDLHPEGVDASPPATGWVRFLVQAQKDLCLWLMLVAFLGLMRLGILLAWHRHWDAGTGIKDLLATISRGARFDMQIVTLVCVFSLLMSIVCGIWDFTRMADRLRAGLGLTFIAIAALVVAIDVGFFREYHSQFNHFLFGALYDDRRAILGTIWASYHPLLNLGAALIAVITVGWSTLKAVRHPLLGALRLGRWRWPMPIRVAMGLVLTVLMVAGARGRITSRPLQIGDAAVVADSCLSSWIPTPFHALGDAYTHWEDMQAINGITAFIPDGDLVAAAAAAFPEVGRRSLIDDYLMHTAPGASKPPRHVFLIIMESYDAWPLMERWRPLHLTDQVAALGAEGILVTDFLPIGTGTMASLAGILTGFPDVGVYTASQASTRRPFSSSPATLFKRLGYRTRFFYSGYMSWQHIGDFCGAQGFDEMYGGGHVGNPEGNEWGVNDEDLFAFTLGKITDDTPSFNIILTTSNHPPFQVNIDRRGFPLKAIPAWTGYDPAGEFDRKILGHLWYSDHSAGNFIRAAEAKLPQTLVALTGDHWSRRSMTARPTCYERSAVPFLLHGPQVLAGVPRPPHAAGGHLDITPTLVELCAPIGFRYPSLGENLLRPRLHLGLGSNRVIGPGFLMEMNGARSTVYPTTGTQPQESGDLEAQANWYRTAYGLGWWRLMRGTDLETKSH